VEQVRHLAERYREVVLSGINLGRWGREPGSTTRLADLIRRLLDETSIERLRLSSVEPMDFSDDLLGLMASSPRIAKHVHADVDPTGKIQRLLRLLTHRQMRELCQKLANGKDTIASSELADAFDRFAYGE